MKLPRFKRPAPLTDCCNPATQLELFIWDLRESFHNWIHPFKPTISHLIEYPIITNLNTYPKMIAAELVSVQPINRSAGRIFRLVLWPIKWNRVTATNMWNMLCS